MAENEGITVDNGGITGENGGIRGDNRGITAKMAHGHARWPSHGVFALKQADRHGDGHGHGHGHAGRRIEYLKKAGHMKTSGMSRVYLKFKKYHDIQEAGSTYIFLL